MNTESVKKFIEFMVEFELNYLEVHRGLIKIVCAKNQDQTYKLVWTDYSETLMYSHETFIVKPDWNITKVK